MPQLRGNLAPAPFGAQRPGTGSLPGQSTDLCRNRVSAPLASLGCLWDAFGFLWADFGLGLASLGCPWAAFGPPETLSELKPESSF
jgi:hypothetical protein